MTFIIILGAIVIISLFVLLGVIVTKAWLKLIDSLEKDQNKVIKSTKKEGLKFLYILLQTDYDTEKYEVIARVAVIFGVLCILTLFLWISVGVSFI